jgi:hypothetical protein
MENNQISSQGAHTSAFSTRNQQSFWARFFLLALFLVLTLTSLQSKAPAQAADHAGQEDKAVLKSFDPPDCDECERIYVECLAGGGGTTCHVQYQACIQNCH